MNIEKTINFIIYLSIVMIVITGIITLTSIVFIGKDISNNGGIGKSIGIFIKNINEGINK